jgi:hypothetical protein
MSKPSGQEFFNKPSERNTGGLGLKEHDSFAPRMEGHLFAVLKFQDGREETRDLGKNIITASASILLARLMRLNTDPAYGCFGLAVGTGSQSWDPQNPPPATAAQTQLQNELFRKQFQSINFTSNGVVSATPTNVIDLTTFFVESEANGALVEMGIVGGDATLVANTGTLVNYRTFAVINKPPTASLTIVWRLSF